MCVVATDSEVEVCAMTVQVSQFTARIFMTHFGTEPSRELDLRMSQRLCVFVKPLNQCFVREDQLHFWMVQQVGEESPGSVGIKLVGLGPDEPMFLVHWTISEIANVCIPSTLMGYVTTQLTAIGIGKVPYV